MSANSRLLRSSLLLAGLAGSLPAQTEPDADNAAAPPANMEQAPDYSTKLTGTYVYLQGDYGRATDTEVQAAFLTAEFDTTRWRVRGTLPAISIDGPANVAANGSANGARPTNSRTTGLGDLTLEGTWKFLPADASTGVDLTGRVKFPTANESHGLGTGNYDYFLQVDLTRRLGQVTLFGNVGWQFLGDSASYNLDDGPYATIGATTAVNDVVTVGGGLNWRSDTGAGSEDGLESFFFAAREINDAWRATVIAIIGFSDASPDFGGGLAFTYSH